MINRSTCLSKLCVGDIFHAEYPNGASCICLVLSVDDATIHAKRITTQQNLLFNRRTGVEEDANGEPEAVIDSVTPLPPEVHNTFLEMNKKYEILMSMDEASRFQDLERHKLSEAEKKALIFVYSHYPSNPLPERQVANTRE
jgi:hypothetical protein